MKTKKEIQTYIYGKIEEIDKKLNKKINKKEKDFLMGKRIAFSVMLGYFDIDLYDKK